MIEQKTLVVGEETAKRFLTPEDIIDCVEKTWKWFGESKVVMPNKITTDMSPLGVEEWFNSMPTRTVISSKPLLNTILRLQNNKWNDI